MTANEIIKLESGNTNNIYLLKEGIFWRAYNKSAMRLCNSLVSYKVNRKYIKKEKQMIFYCGFPENVLDKIKQQAKEKGFKLQTEDEKIITVKGVPKKDDYQKWKVQQNSVKEPEVSCSAKHIKNDDIIRQIREYPLENSTPMQTMLFVQQLKLKITDGIIL